jgi:hypothetical protein
LDRGNEHTGYQYEKGYRDRKLAGKAGTIAKHYRRWGYLESFFLTKRERRVDSQGMALKEITPINKKDSGLFKK